MIRRTLTLALLALPLPALAVSLDDLVEAWTWTVDGQAGSDGVDEARDVAMNAYGDIITVGWLDGDVDHGKDGYAVALGVDGSVLWDVVQDQGATSPNQLSSDDRLYAVSVEPITDSVAWCGRQAGTGTGTDPLGWYWVEALTPSPYGALYPPVSEWDQRYRDGSASPEQDCFGVTWNGGYVFAAGWGQHGVDEGRWLGWRYAEADGLPDAPYIYEYTQYAAVPDQSYGVAQNNVTGDFVFVGARGFAGAPGSLLNDTDWYVRYFDAAGALVWSDRQYGAGLLEDKALAVTLDVATGHLTVAGFRNGGTDNAGGSDRDWWVVQYLADGSINWTHAYGEGDDLDQVATAIDLDDFGDILVGGWVTDAASGLEHWRVSKLSAYDGLELQEWLGPIHAGDAELHGLDFRSGRLAMAGWIDDGNGIDFATMLLDGDRDVDGVADSVDACPDDPLKALDTGLCGCNVSDDDTDGDSVANCLEDCPTDPLKTEAGICGCDEPDDDTDGDGTEDCNDNCPDDPAKTEWGICGCGAPDTDSDGDGVLGCDDACSNTPPGTPVDEFGCPTTDGGTGDTGLDTTDDTDGKSGCGCESGAPSGGLFTLALGMLALGRRRQGHDDRG